jgi:predicted RNA methylase
VSTTAEDRQQLVVYFTKGVGDVVAREIRTIAPGADIRELTEKFAVVEVDASDVDRVRTEARTTDDTRLLVAGTRSVADPAGFAAMCSEAAEATRSFLDRHGSERAGSELWSVTLSARNPVWRRRPQWDPGPEITRHLGGAELTARSRQPVDVRIQVDGDVMHAAVNLEPVPITASPAGPPRLGALRRSVAAVLVQLGIDAADPETLGRGLYDPCCGTGTIVAEAARLGMPVYGSDMDPAAVDITRARLAAPGGEVPVLGDGAIQQRIFTHDLLRGIPGRVDSSIVVSNLPWGKQVSLPRRGDFFDMCAALAGRTFAAGGGCAFLTTHEDQLVARLRKHAPGANVTARRIGLLGQTPAIVTVQQG